MTAHDIGVPLPVYDVDDAAPSLAIRREMDPWPDGSDARVKALRRGEILRIGPFEVVIPSDGDGVVVRGPWGREEDVRTRPAAIALVHEMLARMTSSAAEPVR